MDSERKIEGFSLNKPSFFDNENFKKWKNRFESYVKSIDHDLRHVISVGIFNQWKLTLKVKMNYSKNSFVKI